ncbi:homeobox-like protein HDP1 isoform X2 [Hydra vulgaris]|uniref:homeobox-like protein HDP1 isoform X2 n=2 Tax=Hydra vulgaris TaxID=6087 RepID=UPI001F5EED41|nr:uncharacterized protein MAL13P1.304 isoform X1 [Hydra vulgaris]
MFFKSSFIINFMIAWCDFEVWREKSGDFLLGSTCINRTAVIRQDETHSVYCATQMKEADCYLLFEDSDVVGFIPKNNETVTLKIIPENGKNQFCMSSYKPSLGKILLQDYPMNIYKEVWNDNTGVDMINKSMHLEISNSVIILTVLEHWDGILLKLYVNCKNEGDADNEQRCVLIKYEGSVTLPLSSMSFNKDDSMSTTTTSTTTKATTISTLKSDINVSTNSVLNITLILTSLPVSNGAIINDAKSSIVIAVLSSACIGTLVIVVFILVYICFCSRRKEKNVIQRRSQNSAVNDINLEDGNIVRETENLSTNGFQNSSKESHKVDAQSFNPEKRVKLNQQKIPVFESFNIAKEEEEKNPIQSFSYVSKENVTKLPATGKLSADQTLQNRFGKGTSIKRNSFLSTQSLPVDQFSQKKLSNYLRENSPENSNNSFEITEVTPGHSLDIEIDEMFMFDVEKHSDLDYESTKNISPVYDIVTNNNVKQFSSNKFNTERKKFKKIVAIPSGEEEEQVENEFLELKHSKSNLSELRVNKYFNDQNKDPRSKVSFEEDQLKDYEVIEEMIHHYHSVNSVVAPQLARKKSPSYSKELFQKSPLTSEIAKGKKSTKLEDSVKGIPINNFSRNRFLSTSNTSLDASNSALNRSLSASNAASDRSYELNVTDRKLKSISKLSVHDSELNFPEVHNKTNKTFRHKSVITDNNMLTSELKALSFDYKSNANKNKNSLNSFNNNQESFYKDNKPLNREKLMLYYANIKKTMREVFQNENLKAMDKFNIHSRGSYNVAKKSIQKVNPEVFVINISESSDKDSSSRVKYIRDEFEKVKESKSLHKNLEQKSYGSVTYGSVEYGSGAYGSVVSNLFKSSTDLNENYLKDFEKIDSSVDSAMVLKFNNRKMENEQANLLKLNANKLILNKNSAHLNNIEANFHSNETYLLGQREKSRMLGRQIISYDNASDSFNEVPISTSLKKRNSGIMFKELFLQNNIPFIQKHHVLPSKLYKDSGFQSNDHLKTNKSNMKHLHPPNNEFLQNTTFLNKNSVNTESIDKSVNTSINTNFKLLNTENSLQSGSAKNISNNDESKILDFQEQKKVKENSFETFSNSYFDRSFNPENYEGPPVTRRSTKSRKEMLNTLYGQNRLIPSKRLEKFTSSKEVVSLEKTAPRKESVSQELKTSHLDIKNTNNDIRSLNILTSNLVEKNSSNEINLDNFTDLLKQHKLNNRNTEHGFDRKTMNGNSEVVVIPANVQFDRHTSLNNYNIELVNEVKPVKLLGGLSHTNIK